MAAFSDRMVPEVVQTFWAALQRGEFITDAAAEAGTYRKKGAGGWSPKAVCGRAAAGTSRAASLKTTRSRLSGPSATCCTSPDRAPGNGSGSHGQRNPRRLWSAP